MNNRQILLDFILQIYPMSITRAKEITEQFHEVSFKKGEFFLREGQQCDRYLFLVQGFMRSFATDPDGNEITTNFYKEKQVVFEVSSFFDRTLSKENFHALLPCTGLTITYNQLNQLFHAMPEFREFGRTILVKGYSNLKMRMLATITETAEERYLHLLNNSPEVIQHAPLKVVASYLGVTDSSLSRIRKDISSRA